MSFTLSQLSSDQLRQICSLAYDQDLESNIPTICNLVILTICIFGMIGNAICAIVLSQRSMRSSTNVFLLSLSLMDFVFLLASFLSSGLPVILKFFGLWPYYAKVILSKITPVLAPTLMTCQFGSFYLTMFVSLERCLVVYFPLRVRSYCTVKNACKGVGFVYAFAIITILPLWFSFKAFDIYGDDAQEEILCSLAGETDFVHWGWGPYYEPIMFVLMYLVPLLSLTGLNLAIYLKIRETNKMRQEMTQSEGNEVSIGKMLLCVVTVSILCNSLAFFMAVKQKVFGAEVQNSPEITSINGLLFAINASINFVIYALMGQKFRETLLDIVIPNRRLKRAATLRSSISRRPDVTPMQCL